MFFTQFLPSSYVPDPVAAADARPAGAGGLKG